MGLIAGGGDLSSERLLAAYRSGLFPWFDEPPILWWSPDPRAVITLDSLHLSRSFRRTLRKTSWRVTCTQAYEAVMDGCADREEGTWLTREMKTAYAALKDQGHALSYEVWDGEELVGGLYGVLVGQVFAAESKFHRRTDASKIALAAAVADLFSRGLKLFDVQLETDHLKSMGVHPIGRESYLDALAEAQSTPLFGQTTEGNLLPRVRSTLGLV